MDDITADRYLNWLNAEIGFQTNYHNHKETIAWAATAFYITGIIVLAKYGTGKIACLDWLIVFLAVLAFAFVLTHLYLRGKAAATVMVLMQKVNNLCKEPSKVELKDFETLQNSPWPKNIADEIKGKYWAARTWIYWTTDIVIIIALISATIVASILA